ncbi:DUF4595 domain-containing protein [Hallella bergensis]|uniref:DUF4595 domain-containing protein n=1 Tax=Hallella bergensis TaxID=242750 RepID=UPI0023F28AD9|nr:DUF4595 domain-containing protein [Hallella bergensis]
MKFLKFLVVLTIGITCCMNFTSCSNEEDEPNSGVGNGTVNPATVFTNGIPQKVGGMNLTVNSDGLVSALTDGSVKVTFEYPCMSRANDTDVVMNVSDYEGERVISINLNDLGYSKYWKCVYDDGDIDEYWFEYNSDGQLKKIKIQNSEGGGTVEYTYENGNIISSKMTPSDGGTMKISYGSTPIKNVGSVMILGMFGIGDDDMQYAYYAGLLGKATVSLPIKNEAYFDGKSSVENYTWTINDKGLPTKLTTKYTDSDYSDTEDMYFVW